MGWQTSLRKRLSASLLGNAHYTWGKALCYGTASLESDPAGVQGFDQVGNNRGVCAAAVHVFDADFVYETPRLRNISSRRLRHVAGTWQVSGIFEVRSGLPMGVSQRVGSCDQRPDANGLGPYAEDSPRKLFAQYLNLAAFSRVPSSSRYGEPIRPGNSGKNALWGIARCNVDLGIARNFYITERFRLHVRFDMFNAFNHPTYDGISTNILASDCGRIVGANGGRIGQFAGRLSW